MYCTKCGAQNPDHANFCQKCGSRMERILPPHYEVPGARPASSAPFQKRRDSAEKWMITFIASVIVFVVIVIIGNYFSAEGRLVGRWEIVGDGSPEYMEFFRNGTVVTTESVIWQEEENDQYDYRVEGDYLIFRDDWDGEETRAFYRLDGDYLELYPYDDETVSYRRMD